MWSTKINLSDPEKVFIIVKNGYSTASLTVGQAVMWDRTAVDGITVTKPTTTGMNGLAGIIKDTIAYGSYGQAQVYGYNSDCLVSGGTDVALGDKLGLGIARSEFNLVKPAGTVVSQESPQAIALQAFTTSTAAAKKVFLRLM